MSDSSGTPERPDDALREAYLELLARAVTHTLYDPPDVGGPDRLRVVRRLRELLQRRGVFVMGTAAAGARREQGRDWPVFGQTMIGTRRLEHLRRCVEAVLADRIPGDLIETGVWRGGATIMMRGVLYAHGVTDRSVWVADSFDGLPVPDPGTPLDRRGFAQRERQLAVSRAEVEQNFRRYGLLDRQVHFVEGPFGATLPRLKGHGWALIRLDADMYRSTLDALENLYDDLAAGGYVIVDDYGADSRCRQAVDHFRRDRGINDTLHAIDWTGVYWRK